MEPQKHIPGILIQPDFCTWMRHPDVQQMLLSLAIQEQKLWFSKCLFPRISNEELTLIVSLNEIFEQGKTADLLLRTRRILAVLFAHALIQLDRSPWMEEDWDGRNICFIQRRLKKQDRFDIRGPYICTSIKSKHTTGSKTIDENALADGVNLGIKPIHPYPSLLNLGILLLELESGSRLPRPLGEKLNNINSKHMAALDYVKSIDKNDTYQDGYWDIVESCLDPKFIAEEHDLENDLLMLRIRENIVVPLENTLLLASKQEAANIDTILHSDDEVHLRGSTARRSIWIEKTAGTHIASTSLPTTTIGNTNSSTSSAQLRSNPRTTCEEDPEQARFEEEECALFDEGTVSQDPQEFV